MYAYGSKFQEKGELFLWDQRSTEDRWVRAPMRSIRHLTPADCPIRLQTDSAYGALYPNIILCRSVEK